MIEQLSQKPLIELWITEVGSAMWGMETFASDHDYVVIFANNTRNVLIGNTMVTLPAKTNITIPGIDKPCDISAMEIGHLVHLLKKGNVNAIWAVMSPIVVTGADNNWGLQNLQNLVRKTVSSASYPSIEGMAISQCHDAKKRAQVRDPKKSYATALRTLEFGTRLFDTGEIRFDPPTSKKFNEKAVVKAIHDLRRAYGDSCPRLPTTVLAKPFDDYLYNLRVEILNHWG